LGHHQLPHDRGIKQQLIQTANKGQANEMAFNISDLPPHMQNQVIKKLKAEEKEKKARATKKLLEAEESEEKSSGRSKYRSTKVTVTLPDGTEHTFDSRKEARRYEELRVRQQAGEISDLRLQVKYVLIPPQHEPDIIGKRGGVKKGKLIERECSYIADFVYQEDGETVVEDVKSPITRTPVYRLKRKLLLYVHGIRVHEV
jgi:hypothetical protein